MTTHELTAHNQWLDATIQNNFVFGKTLETHPDLCRRLLELILNVEIKEISYPEREKTINLRSDSKGIRLDVYVEEKGTNRSFDIEMQVSNSDNLAKRMRYYQELIDGDKLKPGQHYNSLGESIIIFICPFDRFKRGRHFYSFHERCDQELDLLLGDGSIKIFLSTKGTINDVSPDILAFLDYVDKGIVSGDFVKELDDAVQLVKSNRKAMKELITFDTDKSYDSEIILLSKANLTPCPFGKQARVKLLLLLFSVVTTGNEPFFPNFPTCAANDLYSCSTPMPQGIKPPN